MDATDCLLPDAAWRNAFRRRLRRWYAGHARELPWRGSRDLYQVWVSEIMLQQTQVGTVESYFPRFIAALPTVQDLADADEQTVLKLWEGLGYYRRARQLHAAAQVVVAEFDGEIPTDSVTLRSLPGIGRYTAGAILSIALDAREPILEANTIRLLARLLAYSDDPTKAAGQKLLWQFAEELLPRKKVSLFNQALMELGSLVCTPRAPACDTCPVKMQCPTFDAGLQDEIPSSTKKMKFEDRREAAVVVSHGQQVWLRRCAPGERWAGLWDFARFDVTDVKSKSLQRHLANQLHDSFGQPVDAWQHLKTIRHGVTRFRITLECYAAALANSPDEATITPKGEARWVNQGELGDYPLNTTARKIAKLLANRRLG